MARVRQVVLGLGALLGAVCLVSAGTLQLLGLTPLVFLSGSMGPQIEAGDLAVAEGVPARDLAAGDVVSVVNEAGVRVTHRLVDMERGDAGAARLTLQGDANAEPDAEVYEVTDAERVVFSVPRLGHVVAAASSPTGRFAAGAYVGICILVLLRRPGATPRASAAGPPRHRREVAAAAVLAVAVAAPVPRATPTLAAFSDAGTLQGTLGARTVTSHAQPTCTDVDGVLVLGNVARLTWSQVASDHEYAWELRRTSDGVAVASGVVGSGVAPGSTVQLDIGTGLIGVNATYDVVVRARLTSTTAWTAATSTSTPVRRVSVLVLGAAFRCGYS